MDFGFLRKLLPGGRSGDADTAAPLDGFPGTADDFLFTEHALLSELLEENDRLMTEHQLEAPKLQVSETGRRILALDRAEQARVVHALGLRLVALERRLEEFFAAPLRGAASDTFGFNLFWRLRRMFVGATRTLLKSKLPLDATAISLLMDWCCSSGDANAYIYIYPINDIVSAIAEFVQRSKPDEAFTKRLVRLRNIFQSLAHRDFQRYARQLTGLLGEAPPFPIVPGEVWADAALADLKALPPERQAWWRELFSHVQDASSNKPSARWLAEGARRLQEPAARENIKHHVLRWFPLVDKPRPTADGTPTTPHPLALNDLNADLLRGLVWLCAVLENDREIPRALAALAVSAYRKVPGLGPRGVRVGNACIHSLGALPGRDALGQLALLKVKVKFGTAQKELAKALNAAAAREGLPAEAMEEMAVPDYGLTEVGRLAQVFGDSGFIAELTITGTHTTELAWRNAQTGKTQRSVPAAVKGAHAEELRELKAVEKDVQKMLPAQAQRLEGLFLQRNRWPLAAWRERYLDHPLVGTLTRRLIWKFHRGDVTGETEFFAVGLWLDGALRDRHGHPLALAEDDASAAGPITVSLWHPLDAGGRTEEITAWRLWLEEHEIRQPFKQAHREVYLLTPAEERTGTYSNRFAAHLLKQHQFHALCAQRGWKNKLRMMVDDTYPPAARELLAWGLRAEYWVEGAGGEYGRDTTESGAFLYLSTDQVRFYAVGAPQLTSHAGGGGYVPGWRHPGAATDTPLSLAEVPALVFSEIMRDVDLFVGVASVGNDPAWNDGGPQGRYRDYWAEYSFGELGATAQTRRDALGRLVPRLKIASRCTLSDRFLLVRGELHTYKIHLGSGNILMSPDDRYLCIVPGPASAGATDAPTAAGGAASKVFLPFEGDRTLSVILSKAFLLAADDRITDPTITRQIRA